jgi:hypothetical protein
MKTPISINKAPNQVLYTPSPIFTASSKRSGTPVALGSMTLIGHPMKSKIQWLKTRSPIIKVVFKFTILQLIDLFVLSCSFFKFRRIVTRAVIIIAIIVQITDIKRPCEIHIANKNTKDMISINMALINKVQRGI